MSGAAKRARAPRLDSRQGILVMPSGDHGSLVHRFDATAHDGILRFLSDNSGNSALICGDAENVLSRLPGGIFQACITSPPYWSLRDYNIRGQIGLEVSVFAYIDHLVRV